MSPVVTRRALLAGVSLVSFDCHERGELGSGSPGSSAALRSSAPRSAPSISAPLASGSLIEGGTLTPREQRVFDFASTPVGVERAMALLPVDTPADALLPVLVALHGRGEAVRGLDVGARGWLDDYQLDRAIDHLRKPPLTAEAFQGLVQPERLRLLNASLAARPYRGLIVVCPWVPDLLSERDRGRLDAAEPFGQFLVDQLLPEVVRQLPASAARASTGIDGVSLGGRIALLAGLRHSDRFGAVGTLQAAIQQGEVAAIAERAARASGDADSLRLRLVTSEHDYFRSAIGHLHEALTEAQVAHEHLVLAGPHDYVWNRGPGGIEMLLWHDRVLRGEAPL